MPKRGMPAELCGVTCDDVPGSFHLAKVNVGRMRMAPPSMPRDRPPTYTPMARTHQSRTEGSQRFTFGGCELLSEALVAPDGSTCRA